jgi:hypothetical protein
MRRHETVESILSALETCIDERVLAGVACGDLTERHLAIYELSKLAGMPASETRSNRVNAIIAKFGQADVDRWLSRI